MNSIDDNKLPRSPQESQSHFIVPDNYFEQLEARIMDSIDKESATTTPERTSQRSLWMRFRPYLSLAAAFLMTIGIFRLFNITKETILERRQKEKVEALAQKQIEISDDEYYDYFADEYSDALENNWLVTTTLSE